MKVPSNRIVDMLAYYTGQLETLYESREATNIVWTIIEHFLGVNRLRLALEPDLRVSESEMLEVHFAVKEVLYGMPVQYVTGIAWFDGRDFMVNKDVLIPRPETEGLLALAAGFLGARPNAAALDACTGSGCLAVSLKLRYPASKVWATDISEEALNIAAANAKKFGVQIIFQLDDMLSNTVEVPELLDLIVSNPPYVPLNEKPTLDKHVLAEPSLALFVPDDNPLIFYHALAKRAANQLRTGGMIAVECHANFTREVVGLLSSYGLSNTEVLEDLHGRLRFVRAFKTA